MIEEIYEKCEVDSGNSSGSGNSSCDEIDVESIDSDRKFEKSCGSIPVGTSDGDSLSSNENRLDPVQTSSFSISNLLKDERSYQAAPNNIFQAAGAKFHSLNHFGNSFFQPHGIWNPILFSPSFLHSSMENRMSGLQNILSPEGVTHCLHGLKNTSTTSACKKNLLPGSLTAEVKTENVEGEHKCEVCGKCFKHIRMLNRHRRNHSPYKKYKCTFCSKGFNDSFDLKRHIRTHTGVKPYKCNSCEKSFTQRCSLESHLDKIHGIKHKFSYKQRREKIYVCEDCGYSTNDVRDHYKHSREQHAKHHDCHSMVFSDQIQSELLQMTA